MAVLEKENELSLHQSKNNSGVIHAGIYYVPGSLKAKLCVEGMKRSYAYVEKKGIPYKKSGKLIVATENYEISELRKLFERATINNVPGAKLINGSQISELEPNCVGLEAIYSPETGIVDWRTVALSFAKDFENLGGIIMTKFEVTHFDEAHQNTDYPLRIRPSDTSRCDLPSVQTKYAICCGGLQSDRLAERTGCSPSPKIIPFRGDYLRLRDEMSDLVKTNIYPVPNPRFPFLGVHFTPRIDGTVWLGPNAILSLDREGYGFCDFNAKDALDSLTYSGFWKLATKYITFGANEIIDNIFIKRQVRKLQRFVPKLKVTDVIRGPSGIRAQALNPDGMLVDDFVIQRGETGISRRVMHVRNAPSPAATSSLAIARSLADEARELFEFPEPAQRDS
ncbi:FAD dependent oxidoreductase, partial [Opisthorchis viverrini]